MSNLLKYAILSIAITISSLHATAQNLESNIKVQALEMVRALLKSDFETFAKYIHPKALAMAGGKEKLIQRMDTANIMAKQFGAEISKILVGNPGKIISYKETLQATLPQTTEMKSGFGNITLETTLIAISTNGGKNWYFIDTSLYHTDDLRKSLPELSPELVIPPLKKPVFIPNNH